MKCGCHHSAGRKRLLQVDIMRLLLGLSSCHLQDSFQLFLVSEAQHQKRNKSLSLHRKKCCCSCIRIPCILFNLTGVKYLLFYCQDQPRSFRNVFLACKGKEMTTQVLTDSSKAHRLLVINNSVCANIRGNVRGTNVHARYLIDVDSAEPLRTHYSVIIILYQQLL